MKKSLLEIYALAVCFVAALTFLAATSQMLNAMAGLAFPITMMDQFAYNKVASNDAYWEDQRIFDPKIRNYPSPPPESVS